MFTSEDSIRTEFPNETYRYANRNRKIKKPSKEKRIIVRKQYDVLEGESVGSYRC